MSHHGRICHEEKTCKVADALAHQCLLDARQECVHWPSPVEHLVEGQPEGAGNEHVVRHHNARALVVMAAFGHPRSPLKILRDIVPNAHDDTAIRHVHRDGVLLESFDVRSKEATQRHETLLEVEEGEYK
ncbi:hypothetical protein XU18_2876 [Perkinsela sp. CCAP 1560/4]|nr:hypothetical protein XU18_2876 [Perkinsela sp. CCAP 1560/4]|eukprot:KNH06371.1 hypothetical protein XU18_2876 [Perkinsela sp. CCAP 1560/4]